MFWQGRRVLVTGAGGFIGIHLVEALVERGAQVAAFVRYNSRADPGLLAVLPAEIQKQVQVVFGDLCDQDAVRQAMQQTEVVFHLGALIAIPYSYLRPRQVVETNVLGTLNVLMAARDVSLSRLIHTSTSEVYGTARRVPIDEQHPLQGQSPYSASKIGADRLAESFYRAYDLPISIIRPFNTFGPRQSARAVIPAIIAQALNREVVELGALHPTRDFTFVRDTVAAFLALAEAPNCLGEEINIGTGVEISIGDLAHQVVSLIGRPVQIVADTRRLRPAKSEVERLIADNRKARELLKWEPKTSLGVGLRETIDWVSQHPERYRPLVYEI
jgi:NAD dependent epimerase/dehydratase